MPTFEDYYNQVMQDIAGDYAQRQTDYEAKQGVAKQGEYDALGTQIEAQKGTTNTTADRTLNEAYVNMLTAKRNLPNYMASQGMYGGPAETTYANLIRDYENSRNKTEATRQQSLTDIGNTYTTQKAGIDSNYSRILADYISQLGSEKETTATNRAGILYQAYQDELTRQEQQRQFDEQQRLAWEQLNRQNNSGSSGGIVPEFDDDSTTTPNTNQNQSGLAGTSGAAGYMKGNSGEYELYQKALAAQKQTRLQKEQKQRYIY